MTSQNEMTENEQLSFAYLKTPLLNSFIYSSLGHKQSPLSYLLSIDLKACVLKAPINLLKKKYIWFQQKNTHLME